MIDLKDLSEILYTIGIYAREKSKPISERVIAEYKEILKAEKQANSPVPLIEDESDDLLNRVKFAEVLLMVIKADHIHSKGNLNDENFSYSQELKKMFSKEIIPFLTRKDPE